MNCALNSHKKKQGKRNKSNVIPDYLPIIHSERLANSLMIG